MSIKKVSTLLLSILFSLYFLISLSSCNEDNNYGRYDYINAENKTKSESGKNVKLGVAVPLTGNLAYYGESLLNGAVLALEEVNKPKNKKDKSAGLFGYPVKLVVEDTGTDSQRSIRVAEKFLLTDEVSSVVCACDSSVALKMNEILGSSGIIVISPTANAEELIDSEGEETLFHLSPSTEKLSQIISKNASNKEKDYKYVSVIYPDSLYGRDLAEGFAKKFRRSGRYCDLFSYEKHDFVHSNLISVVRDSLSRNNDKKSAVFIVGYPENTARILKQFSQMDIKAEFFFGDYIQSSALFRSYNIDLGYLEGSWGLKTKPYNASYKKNFDRLYEKMYRTEPTLFTYKMYDALAINILALAEAGRKASKNKIIKAIEKITNTKGTKVYAGKLKEGLELIKQGKDINYVGLSGDIEFDKKGTFDEDEFTIWEIRGGQMIDPNKIKEQKKQSNKKNKKDKN